jgi:Arc/MetJ family transcription regulator/tRNA A-37 threonylcarbamoyl transferase component Bud32
VADGLIAPPGLTPLADGREAQVFVRADGNVVKVMRSANQEARVRREAAALQALADHRHLAPAFVETTEIAGRPALVTERVSGDDLLARLSKKPWLVLKVAGALGRAHAAMHDHRSPETLPDLRDELARRIQSAKALPEHHATAALDRLRALPTGDRLCHGDYHPQNVLGTLKDPVIIDWGDASRGAPAADVARTLVLLRHGGAPTGHAGAHARPHCRGSGHARPALPRCLPPLCRREATAARRLATVAKWLSFPSGRCEGTSVRSQHLWPYGLVYHRCMSRTNIDIDEDACRVVMQRYHLATKREAVNFALRTVAGEPLSLDRARALRGSGWDGDLEEMRASRAR